MTHPPPPFTNFFTPLGFSLSSVWHRTQCFPKDPNKWNLLSSLHWALGQFSSVHTTCSSAKVSLVFWVFLLMRGFVTAECASLKHAERQILTLFSAELASNSSCSVEPIPHRESLHYPGLSCICLKWTTSLFGGLDWIHVSDIVNLIF